MESSAAAALPSGIVTFLFTDIEGSTRRWDRNHDAMQDAVRLHDRILRDAIVAHGGAVFKTIGDAFCAAFPSAEGAAHAALDAQRGLQAADFTSVNGLKVRMALNTGTADERDGDYFGATLNRVARLLAIGNGGQILLAHATADLVNERAPKDAALVDLGTHRLKDLAAPERVYQLIAEDLHTDARPLRSRQAAATNVPAPTTSFVGRRDDVVRAVGLLEAHRLLTITGPGGMGKTRLAMHTARWVADAWDDGVWLVELAPIAEGGLIPQAIATAALDTQLGGDDAHLTQLVAALGDKRMLLVLDNCEHVLDAVSTTAAAILRGCPNIEILASSRQPLAIMGEVVLRLGSLEPPDAFALFTARAAEADHRFTLDDESKSIVAEICRQLDGIPLAIELAAARVRLLKPQALLERLRHRLRTLVGGARDLTARQRTLRATIDWSYDLLDAQAQRLFRIAGIFVDGFTPTAIACVVGDPFAGPEDAFEALCALESQSLVMVDYSAETTRFRLLESLREYALERLTESGGREAAASAHLAFLRDLAVRAEDEFMRSGSDTAYAQALSPEVEDVRAALAWSLTSGDVADGAELLSAVARPWNQLGVGAEGIARVEEFIARMPSGHPRQLARLWTRAAYLAGNSMRANHAFDAAVKAVTFAREADDHQTLAWALASFALVAARLRRFEEADAALEEARKVAGPDAGAAQRLTELEVGTFVAQLRGRYDDAAAAYEEQLALLHASGDEYGAVYRTMSLAETELARGNPHRAAELARGLLPIAPHLGVEHHAALVSNLAGYLLAIGDVDGAREAALESVNLLATRDASSPWIVTALQHLAAVAALDGDVARAARLDGYCDAQFARIGFEREAAEAASHKRLQAIVRDHATETDGAEATGRLLTTDEAVAEGRALSRR